MDTPGARNEHALLRLYGAYCGSINRRAMIGGIGAAIALPASLAARPHADASGVVARALAAAGGAALLARVRTISWSATARVYPDKAHAPIDLSMEVRLEPFVRARSDTWVTSEGRSAGRTVMIEGHRAFVVTNTAQNPLPPGLAQYERHQLGVYGYLLLTGATLAAAGSRRITAHRDGYPPITLGLGPDGRIVSADYAIASRNVEELPDVDGSAKPIREHFSFSGSIIDQGVQWPRLVSVMENGQTSLRMTITEFSVELAPA